MVLRNWIGISGTCGLILLGSGCAYFTPMAEVETPDGRTVKAPASTIAQMEYNWSREKQLAQIEQISERLLARPDSDGNVSAEGENGHNWKQAMVARDMASILQDGTNPYDVEIVRTRERHLTGRAAILGLGVPFARAGADKLMGGDGYFAAGGRGTYIKQNNRIEGSHLSNSGDLAGGPGGDGAAEAAAGEAAAAAGAPGAAGGGAEGGSRNISIGGIGNMSNSQDAYNGFQNRWNEILHGTGTIGKQPQAGFGGENVFAPIDDADEGSAKLF